MKSKNMITYTIKKYENSGLLLLNEQNEEVTSYTLYKRFYEKVAGLGKEILILVVLNISLNIKQSGRCL